MPPDNAPDQFEWVSAQAHCTAPSMFERLRAGVKQDVEHRNTLAGLDDGVRFEFSEDGDVFDVARLEVSRFADPKIAALVRFERAGRRINVQGEDVDVEFTAVLTLDPAGQCHFVAVQQIDKYALARQSFSDSQTNAASGAGDCGDLCSSEMSSAHLKLPECGRQRRRDRRPQYRHRCIAPGPASVCRPDDCRRALAIARSARPFARRR